MSTTSTLRAADRMDRMGFTDIVKIRDHILEMRGRGIDVIQLEGGEPFAPVPPFAAEPLHDAIRRGETRYAPSAGVPPLIEAIRTKLSRRNGLDVKAENIIATSGGTHGLFCTFQVTLNEGDEVLLLSPYWSPVYDQMRFSGAEVVRAAWADAKLRGVGAALEAKLTPKTRLIYVNTPCNPTGDILTRKDLEEIAAIARERDLIVVSDEAYESIVYDGEHVSIASLPGMFERTISVFTLSKSFSMTGLRVGYLVGPEVWMNALRRIVLYSTNGVTTPVQYAAAAALLDESDYIAQMREEYRKRRDLIVGAALDAGFRCTAPAGAFYLFPDVREKLGEDSWKAMRTLLETSGIASVPGVIFGDEGEGHLRMSFSLPMETLERAARALQTLR